MDEEKDKNNSYNQDMILENKSISNKIYNYFYLMLKDKKEISFLEIYILYILEAIQLMSYGLSYPHMETWKENHSTMKTISDIISISRISSLMKYVKFNIYLIIFFILVVFIFAFAILLIMQIILIKPESKSFNASVNIIRMLIYPLFIFFYIPITELVLLPLKCNSENKVDIVLNGIKCWESMHYLYIILGIIASILFFLSMFFLLNLFFYPFNYHDSSIKLHSGNDVLFLIIKYIFVIRYVIVKNEYLSISILFLFSLLNLIQEFFNNSYNNTKIEIFINIKNFLSFWTYFILLFAKFFESTKLNGLIYIFSIGIPIIIISSILLLKHLETVFDYNIANFKNLKEYLEKTRVLIKLITSFIEGSKNIRFDVEGDNQKEDILLKGIIKIHTLSCIREECPLTKFIKNPGNYNIQKQCLLNYMSIYFNLGMKRFPFSTELILYYIQFNFSNRSNMNSVRTNISLVQKYNNTDKINFIIFLLSKDIRNMKSNNIDGDSTNYEQEHEILNQKYRRLKYLIENSSKLYGEFWGIFATNITNNLNTFKLYNLGQKLNLYLKEINNLWDNELKAKKLDSENQVIVQLYSRFLREILWNKKKSEEIGKKLNDENQHHHETKKRDNKKNSEGNNIETELESPNYIIYSTSNEKGECTISQCTNSIVNLLGYLKSEIVGKRIEVIMPEIFKVGHNNMLADKIKQLHQRHKSERNSYRDNEKKNIFIVAKSKMGYLVPLSARHSIYEDTDFSNSFIIKSNMEAKDTKSVYAYYILTKSDFSINAISSSAINLGITMDILNKYVIHMEFLVRNKNNGIIDFSNKFNEYEEELKEIIWIYPDLIYPKDKINNNIKGEDIPDLIKASSKKKMFMQISVMKYNDIDIVGYVFKFVDSISKKKDSGYIQNSIIPQDNKEILFDLLTLNYIRTATVKVKTGINNLREKVELLGSEKQTSQSNEKINKKSINSNLDEIAESSEEEKNAKRSELTKEKLLELQTKDSKEIENFINFLPYYGADVSLEKHRPNKERYPVGRGHEALIKTEIGKFVIKIENKINSNPELLRKIKGIKEDENKSADKNNDFNHEFSSDTSASLANIFKSKSIFCIKITSLVFFILFLLNIVLEFIFTFLNVNKIKKNITYMKNAYKLFEDITFIKYFITEAILANKYGQNYIILNKYNLSEKLYIDVIKTELAQYRQDFSYIFEDFSSTSTSEFSKECQDYVNNNTQVLLYTKSNNEEINQTLPFVTALNRIPTTVFYISSISDDSVELNMNERNCYELMYNLLNDLFIHIEKFTNILSRAAMNSSKSSLVSDILFYASFFCSIIFLFIVWKVLANFLIERQKPINLFLTIKKQIFEDLKNASEGFSNKLLNKLFGNEENEEESQKDYQTNVKENDINIIKFKAPMDYKMNGKNNKEQFRNFMALCFFFIILEAYMIFKFCFSKKNIQSIEKFLDVFNITQHSYVDIVKNIDVTKSYYFNKSIPIFNKVIEYNDEKRIAPYTYNFYNITKMYESIVISTSNTKSFLSGSYKDSFSEYLYHDFNDLFKLDTRYLLNEKLLILFQKGFRPVIFNIFEKLRFFYIHNYLNKENIINDEKWVDLDFLLLRVIRPWYSNLIEKLNDTAFDFLNSARVVQISVFIIIIAIFTLCYFIVWKSYEESLYVLLQRSFDLINLIPEEIKYLIVSKLNDN